MANLSDRTAPVDTSVDIDRDSPFPVRLNFGRRVMTMSREEARRLSNELNRAAADSFQSKPAPERENEQDVHS